VPLVAVLCVLETFLLVFRPPPGRGGDKLALSSRFTIVLFVTQ